MEVKLTDRVAVLEKLLEQLKEEEKPGACGLFESLDRPAAPEGCAPSDEILLFRKAAAGSAVVVPGEEDAGKRRHHLRRGGAEREDPVPGALLCAVEHGPVPAAAVRPVREDHGVGAAEPALQRTAGAGELGFQWEEKVSRNLLKVRCGGVENTYFLFGGKDEGARR